MKYTSCIFYLCLCIFFTTACNEQKSSTNTQVDYQALVKSLETQEQKLAFLQGMYDTDERLRRELPKIIQSHGYKSEEHNKIEQELKEFTEQSIEKSIAYLQVWGFPDKQTLRSNSAETPFHMLHHSDDIQLKREYFPFLWQAFKDRDIPGSAIAKYLNKLYKLETGESMVIKGGYTEVFEVDTLLRSLNIYVN